MWKGGNQSDEEGELHDRYQKTLDLEKKNEKTIFMYPPAIEKTKQFWGRFNCTPLTILEYRASFYWFLCILLRWEYKFREASFYS
jgi:hypothetical protein